MKKASKSKLRDDRVDESYPSLRERLETIGERMIELASRVTEDGLPMNDEEKRLCINANSSYLEYEFQECLIQYMATGYADTLYLDKMFHGE